jgi:peptidoglycan/LPS O-acetylase OafA/YrhL
VVGSHWVGVFFGSPDAVASATNTPLETGPVPALFSVFAQPWLNFGPFGVALFFLVSGLAIPISLGNHTRGRFIVARALRIFPTYMIGLAIGTAAVTASALYWGLPMPFGVVAVAINGLLVFDLMGRASIDLVNWTLATELKFYLLMMLTAPLIRRGSLGALFTLAFATLGYNLVWGARGFGWLQDRFFGPFSMASLEALSVGYMLIGVMFSYHVRGQIASGRAWLVGAALGVMFAAGWLSSVSAAQFAAIAINYLSALMLFTALYLARGRIRSFAPLEFLASISFPLYAIHSLLGYCLLKLLMLSSPIPYYPALALTFVIVVGVATLLSVTIERRSINIGRRLSVKPPPVVMRKLKPASAG